MADPENYPAPNQGILRYLDRSMYKRNQPLIEDIRKLMSLGHVVMLSNAVMQSGNHLSSVDDLIYGNCAGFGHSQPLVYHGIYISSSFIFPISDIPLKICGNELWTPRLHIRRLLSLNSGATSTILM